MFFLWYLLTFILIINSCIADQLCISSCRYVHTINTDFNLPSACGVIRKDVCSVTLIFDYNSQSVTIDFGTPVHKQRLGTVYQTDNTVRSVINLEEPSFIQHTVQYSCSTGDQCDLRYVGDIAIPSYAIKSCHTFRATLIQHLHSVPPSSSRECFLENGKLSLCNASCDLIYENPDKISRSCDSKVDLAFEITVGHSTPTDKPEYNYRSFAYGCTTQFCNGKVMEGHIQRWINLDDGECMAFPNKTIPTTAHATLLTTKRSNHAATFSQSLILIIFIASFGYIFL